MPATAPSQISICKTALRRCRATVIQDINENSNEAANCRDLYPQIIARALEGDHNWSFANQRVQLAVAGTNDRPYEWLYAYLVPQNMAAAIRVLPDLQSLGIALPQPIPGEPYSETWATLNGYEVPYEILSGTLYTNAENAWLDFTINDITGIAETNLFADAVAWELSAELAVTIKGDDKIASAARSAAELAWQRAIAADRNRQPQDWGNYLSEAMVARHSGAITYPGPGRAA
jgi:hypothetical protein